MTLLTCTSTVPPCSSSSTVLAPREVLFIVRDAECSFGGGRTAQLWIGLKFHQTKSLASAVTQFHFGIQRRRGVESSHPL